MREYLQMVQSSAGTLCSTSINEHPRLLEDRSREDGPCRRRRSIFTYVWRPSTGALKPLALHALVTSRVELVSTIFEGPNVPARSDCAVIRVGSVRSLINLVGPTRSSSPSSGHRTTQGAPGGRQEMKESSFAVDIDRYRYRHPVGQARALIFESSSIRSTGMHESTRMLRWDVVSASRSPRDICRP